MIELFYKIRTPKIIFLLTNLSFKARFAKTVSEGVQANNRSAWYGSIPYHFGANRHIENQKGRGRERGRKEGRKSKRESKENPNPNLTEIGRRWGVHW